MAERRKKLSKAQQRQRQAKNLRRAEAPLEPEYDADPRVAASAIVAKERAKRGETPELKEALDV